MREGWNIGMHGIQVWTTCQDSGCTCICEYRMTTLELAFPFPFSFSFPLPFLLLPLHPAPCTLSPFPKYLMDYLQLSTASVQHTSPSSVIAGSRNSLVGWAAEMGKREERQLG